MLKVGSRVGVVEKQIDITTIKETEGADSRNCICTHEVKNTHRVKKLRDRPNVSSGAA